MGEGERRAGEGEDLVRIQLSSLKEMKESAYSLLSQSRGPVVQSHQLERGGGRRREEKEGRIERLGRVGKGSEGKRETEVPGKGRQAGKRPFPIRYERGMLCLHN